MRLPEGHFNLPHLAYECRVWILTVYNWLYTHTLYHQSVADTVPALRELCVSAYVCLHECVCVCGLMNSAGLGSQSQSASLLWTLSAAIKGDGSMLPSASQTASAAAERAAKMRRTLYRISCFVTLAVELGCISVTLGMYREGGSKASMSLTFKLILVITICACLFSKTQGFSNFFPRFSPQFLSLLKKISILIVSILLIWTN